jgi:uncharacterized membrane protein YhiD involved in acid resistance
MFSVVFWKKVWTWIKHHWYWPVIIILLLFAMFAGASSREKLFDLISKQRKNYEEEIKIIKSANEEKDANKEKAIKEHVEEIKKIEEEHDIKIEELEAEKQEEIIKIVDNHKGKDKPEELAKEIAKLLGAKYVEDKND